MRRSGEGTRTWRSASSARSIASFHEAFWCSTNISAIWRPTGDSGLSAVIGSWKIMPMRLPRSSAQARGRGVLDLLAVEHDAAACRATAAGAAGP